MNQFYFIFENSSDFSIFQYDVNYYCDTSLLNLSDYFLAIYFSWLFSKVLITEWLRTGEQADMLDTFFQKGPTSIRQTLEQRGDLDMRTSLYPFFAPDEVELPHKYQNYWITMLL